MRDAGTFELCMHQATVTFRLAIKVVHDGRHIILTGSSSRQLYKEMADNQQKEGAQPKEDAGEKSPATASLSAPTIAVIPTVPAAPLSRHPNPKLNRQRKLTPLSKNATCSAWST